MSTILDALRKASGPKPQPSQPPAAVAVVPELEPQTSSADRGGTAMPLMPTQPDVPSDRPKPVEPTAIVSPSAATASPPEPVQESDERAAAGADATTIPHEDPQAGAPPPGDFPPPDEPSFLPPDDDSKARTQKLIRAAVVVVIGIVLGLFVGRRFLPESGTGADDLLSDAVLARPPARTETKENEGTTAKPASVAPAPSAAVPQDAEVVEPGAKQPAEPDGPGAEKGRGGRAEKPRREGGKKDGEKPSESSPPETTEGEQPSSATAPAAPPSQPQQVRPKPAIMPDPAATQPPPSPSPAATEPELAAPAIAAVPPAAPLPPPAIAAVPPAAPLPPPAVTPPPAAPIALPPPPDDAPVLALLFIQWSSEPARRVASLRQSGGSIYIVREGDIVQGLRIAVIRPTGVEVQWRGQSFLLPVSRQ